MLIITATLKKAWTGRAIFALSSNPTEYCFIDSYYAFNAIKASIGAHKHIYSAFIKCHIISYYRRERSLYAFMHLNGTQTFVVYLKIWGKFIISKSWYRRETQIKINFLEIVHYTLFVHIHLYSLCVCVNVEFNIAFIYILQ